jgi:hypothetical protein
MLVLTSFMNDKYRILKCLYDNQIKVRNNVYVALSQQEISDIMHFSKNKTNKIMQELKKEGFIDSFKNTKGKYIITNNGNIAINIIEKKY